MSDPTGRALAKWTYLGTGIAAGLVAAAALLLGYPRLAWGFAAGAATGGLVFGGLLLVVYVLLAPASAGVPAAHKGGIIAFQVVKYLLVLAVLYVLIVRWRVDLLGLAAGLITPVLIAMLITLLRPRPAPKSGAV